MNQPGEQWNDNEVVAEDPIMVDIDQVNGRIAEYCPQLTDFLGVRGEAVEQVRLFRRAGRNVTYQALRRAQPLLKKEKDYLMTHLDRVEGPAFLPLFDIQYAWATGNPLGGPAGVAKLIERFNGNSLVRALLYIYGFPVDPPPDIKETCAKIPMDDLHDAFFGKNHAGQRGMMEEFLRRTK